MRKPASQQKSNEKKNVFFFLFIYCVDLLDEFSQDMWVHFLDVPFEAFDDTKQQMPLFALPKRPLSNYPTILFIN